MKINESGSKLLELVLWMTNLGGYSAFSRSRRRQQTSGPWLGGYCGETSTRMLYTSELNLVDVSLSEPHSAKQFVASHKLMIRPTGDMG